MLIIRRDDQVANTPARSRHCKREDTKLSPSLTQLLPACAESCVSSYIRQFWLPQQCTDSTDDGCLCREYSGTGYTLGEIALACMSSNCPQAPSEQASKAYHVCDQQTDAATATHSILTVLVSSSTSQATSTTASSSQLSRNQTTVLSTTTTRSASPSTLETAFTATPTSTDIPIVTSIASAPSSPAPTGSSDGSELTSGQAVGITVGAFGGLAFVALLFFCCICIRRRKNQEKDTRKHKKRDSLDFVCVETPRFPPVNQFPSHSRNASHTEASQAGKNRVTQWLAPDAAKTTNHQRAVSKSSVYSDRTVSYLLPDRPQMPETHGHNADSRTMRPFSTQTEGTVFEEDRTPWSPGLQKPAPIQLKFRYPPTRNGRTEGQEQTDIPRIVQPDSRPNSRTTTLTLQIPKQIPVQRQLAEDIDTSKEVHVRPYSADPSVRTPLPMSGGGTFSASSATSYLPSYYTSEHSRTPMVPFTSPSKPRIAQHPFRSPPPSKPLPQAPGLQRKPSGASETSFESVDPTEVTPPSELDRRLPKGASPISGLKYPRIPRSASQAVPRSPHNATQGPQPHEVTSTASPTRSLVTARRGPQVAAEMQQRMRLADAFQPTSPKSAEKKNRDSLLSYETPVKMVATAQQMAFVTPPPRKTSRPSTGTRPKLSVFPSITPTPPTRSAGRNISHPQEWGPKLTPTKRGDEFFISVGSP